MDRQGDSMIFKDRADAGRQLAEKLINFQGRPDTIVLGLPRGGVVTAFEIAKKLSLPLDIIVPRKIGAPFDPELAVGAITEDGSLVLNHEILDNLGLRINDLQTTIDREKQEAARRLSLYRQGRQELKLKGKTVILVDDGVATGATMEAAIASVKSRGARAVIIAIPVAPPQAIDEFKKQVDDVISLLITDHFWGISSFYEHFAQTQDDQVIDLMKQSLL